MLNRNCPEIPISAMSGSCLSWIRNRSLSYTSRVMPSRITTMITLENVIVVVSNPASSSTLTKTPQQPQQMPAMIGSVNAIVLIIPVIV